MAARFTEHAGDPQWLRDQRDGARRAMNPPVVRKAMPYPTQTPQHQPKVLTASTQQFVAGAKDNSGAAFVLGAVVGYLVGGGRGRRR